MKMIDYAEFAFNNPLVNDDFKGSYKAPELVFGYPKYNQQVDLWGK